MIDYDWLQDIRQYRAVWVSKDEDGKRIFRPIEDVELPESWEVDKTVRPVLD